jgi:hypothetical protein
LGNPNTSQDRRNALLTELAARNWDLLSSGAQKELKGLLDKLECGKLNPDETAQMARFLGVSKDLVTGGGQEAQTDTPKDTPANTPANTPADGAPATAGNGGPVEKMSDGDIRAELGDKQIPQERRRALLDEMEQRKLKSDPDGNSRNDLSALMTMMKEGRISGDDVRRLAQKLGISEDQIYRPTLRQGGDELHAKVDGMSDDQLGKRLNDPDLTWEQRKVIVTELKDRVHDRNKHDPVGLTRLQNLDNDFRTDKLSQKDQETYAKWLGIPQGDLYRRP